MEKLFLLDHQDKTACLWNTTTGELLQILTGHTDAITSVAFSPDGKHCSYWISWIIQLVCGMLLQENNYTYLQDIQIVSHSVAFSPDGKTVLTGSYDRTACLWNATTGEQLQVLTGHTD